MNDVQVIWQEIKNKLQIVAPEVLLGLQVGAPAKDIEVLETHLGVTLPEDYKTFLKLCNGQADDAEFGFYDGELLSVGNVQFQWDVWKKLLDDATFQHNSQPQPGIRNDWYNPKWIPFTHDGGGNHLCLDLDPAAGGRYGQVITMWHDSSERELMFESFTDWLNNLRFGLESGEIVFDKEEYNALVNSNDLF